MRRYRKSLYAMCGKRWGAFDGEHLILMVYSCYTIVGSKLQKLFLAYVAYSFSLLAAYHRRKKVGEIVQNYLS